MTMGLDYLSAYERLGNHAQYVLFSVWMYRYVCVCVLVCLLVLALLKHDRGIKLRIQKKSQTPSCYTQHTCNYLGHLLRAHQKGNGVAPLDCNGQSSVATRHCDFLWYMYVLLLILFTIYI